MCMDNHVHQANQANHGSDKRGQAAVAIVALVETRLIASLQPTHNPQHIMLRTYGTRRTGGYVFLPIFRPYGTRGAIMVII